MSDPVKAAEAKAAEIIKSAEAHVEKMVAAAEQRIASMVDAAAQRSAPVIATRPAHLMPITGKMVKVKALMEFNCSLDPMTPKIAKVGDVVEVTEEMAAYLCKRSAGVYNFSGERPIREATTHTMQRAERVA